ncbi:UDP-N-acetylmuramate dehydrogenase [Fangia hongkongensis]|uniref:UDP-N-acetylmuramate dehydrogenase n=1 Tax=Fangia hongkongensis TaxID=270495 RepID=UPI00038115B6|nr:UDP-N-acetylmuramate dehydrogenase [Fangia hongkongensis]MBK2125376.1 UDP-N-acetylmuramate dehydrogenase [Fangia hongkongensis]
MISLKKYNTYAIDAKAEHVYFPKGIQEIVEIYQNHQKVVVLGNGSNVILAKALYHDCAFVIFSDNFNQITKQEDGIYAEAGALLRELSLYAYEHKLSGMETFFDVPASVGGAMIMNTGAYGDEMYDHLCYVNILNLKTNKCERFEKKDIDYGYRYSMFKTMPCLILGAFFHFQAAKQDKIKEKMNHILAQRMAKLPRNPSAGSVFKRPKYHITVGEMVEKIGLKGHQIGGAQIANKHGGVIINLGNATGEDVLKLVLFIKEKIYQHYQVELVLEQIVVD